MTTTASSLSQGGEPGRPSAAVAAELMRAARILILTHESPDGDGIGTMLGLRLALVWLGKTVDGVLPEACPAKYRFLPGAETLVGAPPSPRYDCAVALDCDGETRLGALSEAFRSAPRTVVVDHHEAERPFGQVNWCDASKAATGLMAYSIIRDLGVPVSGSIATCLYSAIVADTGSFRFQNTSCEALAVAAELVAAGADAADIARRISDQMPLPKARLLARALGSLEVHSDGAVVLAAVDCSDFTETGALPEHTDGLIDELRRIENVHVVALMRESEPGRWRISLRSLVVDVAAICRRFGGGGHRVAAGCEMSGARSEVAQRLAHQLTTALDP